MWPRRSWLRSTRYVTKRIMRLTATPHAVAAGVAVGITTSFSPFLGLHFLIAFALAVLVRGNVIAAALGTFFGNPLSFPFIWAATYETGHFLLQTEAKRSGAHAITQAMKDIVSTMWKLDFAASANAIAEIWSPLLYPMSIGGALLGTMIALPFYFITRRATVLFREKRRNRLMEQAAAIRARARKNAGDALMSKAPVS